MTGDDAATQIDVRSFQRDTGKLHLQLRSTGNSCRGPSLSGRPKPLAAAPGTHGVKLSPQPSSVSTASASRGDGELPCAWAAAQGHAPRGLRTS